MQGHLNVLREMCYPGDEHEIPISRMSRRLLCYSGFWDEDRNQVVTAKGLYTEHGPLAVIDTLVHELVHWHLQDVDERPHGLAFRAEAERLGVELTGPEHSQHKRRRSNKRYRYVCRNCGSHEETKRRCDISCAVCHPEGYSEEYRLELAHREVVNVQAATG